MGFLNESGLELLWTHIVQLVTGKSNEAKAYTDSEISEWVGDKTVSTQISEAVANINSPVTSVNGKTGAVTLSASDVGADVKGTAQTKINGLNIANGSASGSLRLRNARLENSEYTMGENAFAEGYWTTASGTDSHAEGHLSFALGAYSHAENGQVGHYTIHLTGEANSVEYICNSNSDMALIGRCINNGFIEAYIIDTSINDNGQKIIRLNKTLSTVAITNHSCSLYSGAAYGQFSHSEGEGTLASGNCSHAEGHITLASGYASHAEGSYTVASESDSHAEGTGTLASGDYSHAEGQRTIAYGTSSHAEGYGESYSTTITGDANSKTYTCSDVSNCKVGRIVSLDTIYAKITDIVGSTITLDKTLSANALSEIEIKILVGIAYGNGSHVEGDKNIASGYASHAEGSGTIASYTHSHAEGTSTIASGVASHAEGVNTTASGRSSHAEGVQTLASGHQSHSEGRLTDALGECSHAEGYYATASGYASHASGCYTDANGAVQHVIGSYNIKDTENKYIHIAGNGNVIIGENNTTTNGPRSNAHTLAWDGTAWFQGNVYVGGTGQDDAAAERLVRQSELAVITIDEIDAICGTTMFTEEEVEL